MQHRTRVLATTNGAAGICSCGFVTPDGLTKDAATIAVNDHELAALTKGVKVTYNDPAQLEIPTRRNK